MGDKNPGVSNAILQLGLWKGLIAALIDFAKTVAAWLICGAIFTEMPYASLIGASFTVIGHCFSVFMRFKGGKGMACFSVLYLFCSWQWALLTLPVFILCVIIFNNLYIGCLVAYMSFIVCSIVKGDVVQIVISVILFLLFLFLTRKTLWQFIKTGKFNSKITDVKPTNKKQ